MRRNTIYICTFLVVLSGIVYYALAASNRFTPPEFARWLNSSQSGLHDSVQIGDRTYTATMLPVEMRRLINDSVSDALVLRIGYRSLRDLPDATFDGISSYAGYATRIAEIAFRIKDRVVLQLDGRTINAVGSQYQYAQGLDKSVGVLVTFPVTQAEVAASTSCMIDLDDVVFGEGTMRFTFKPSSLRNIPAIDKSAS